MHNTEDAFRILANSNRFAEARKLDQTLRTYIGNWKSGKLSKYKMQAMLKKWGFKLVAEPMYELPEYPLKSNEHELSLDVRTKRNRR